MISIFDNEIPRGNLELIFIKSLMRFSLFNSEIGEKIMTLNGYHVINSFMEISSAEEKKRIIQKLQLFINGHLERDMKKLEKSLYVNSRYSKVLQDENKVRLEDRTIEDWAKIIQTLRTSKDNCIVKIEDIKIHETIAFAQLKWIAKWPAVIEETVDFLTLIKFQGEWWIINKACHTSYIGSAG